MCDDNECCCSSEEHKNKKTEECCNSEKEKECCDKETPSAGEILEELEQEDKEEETKEEELEAREDQNPAEEQGIEEETEEATDIKMEMSVGEKDEDLDTEVGREKQVEDDEIEPEEAGFMQGESGAGQLGKDALTGEPLMDIEDVVEAVIDGTTYRFVNEENAEEFRRKKEKEDL